MLARDPTVVIGAGVVGLAIARRLALAGHDVIVLEAESTFGLHASSRNSEVIHAGLYYPAGSLKARLCNAGRPALYAFCEAHDVRTRRVGKLIVATSPDERPVLERIADNAAASGGGPLRWLDAKDVRRKEPALQTVGALWSPDTGIVDSHGYMHALLRDAEAHGAMVAWNTAARRVEADGSGFIVHTASDALRVGTLVITAGHGSQALGATIPGVDPPKRYLAKGSYARLRGPSPCSTLVYPVPATASLGVHLTLDLGGAARFGPDQQWVDDLDVTPDPARLASFYPAVRRYWPGLPDDALCIDYAGVRVKVQAPGTPMSDFVIDDHGLPGLVALYGIESPGLTASLALADEVHRRLCP
ncbi:MAG: NAD(P)/FAD-dependent oxidoreductase [Myxococcota bacterium]